MMCVQNDMLTIAGEARRPNGTHPNRSRKRSPVRRCGVPDSSRRAAACADSQNFTCARHVRNGLPYRLTFRFVVILRLRNREFDTGSRLHLTALPDRHSPACMHVQARLAGSSVRLRYVENRRRYGHAQPDQRACGEPGRALYSARIVSGPENAHLRHSMSIHLDAHEPPTHVGWPAHDSRKRSPYRKNAAQQRVRKWLPKNLTVTGAVSKIPISSDTYAQKAFGCASPGPPEKPHLSTGILHTTTVCRPPKNLTCAKTWHSKNEISSSPGGLFGESGRSQAPKNLTFDHFFSKFSSRKASPVDQVMACDPCPEKAHLTEIEAGKPGFPSRKTSPLGHHRRRKALLLCKMAFAPGNPHSKCPWRPVKPHLSRNLPKRWAESGREAGPANPHPCLHRQKTVQSGTARVPWLCGPENPHLWENSRFTVIPNPLTTLPATAHAAP